MIINITFRKWAVILLFNLVLLAVSGTLLRYKIAFSLPAIDQQAMLHAHSHFAFSGWLSQAFMFMMLLAVFRKTTEPVSEYNTILLTHLISAYGILISFLFGDNNLVYIIFSLINVIAALWFAGKIFGKLKSSIIETTFRWFKTALVFFVLSLLGSVVYSWIHISGNTNIKLHLIIEYFFLHFTYNGWFVFAGFGLLYSFFTDEIRNSKRLYRIWLMFTIACVPAYLLSVLWLKLNLVVHLIVVAAALMQLVAWFMLMPAIKKLNNLNKVTSVLWMLAAVAYTIKLILQAGSTIPELSHFAFGYRPVVIGYLHLMLLGVCSFFVIGSLLHSGLIRLNKIIFTGVLVFITGVILNELFLSVQGISAIVGTYFASIQYWLFGAVLVIFCGAVTLFTGILKTDTGS